MKIPQSKKELENLLLAAYKEGMKRIAYIENLKFSESQYEKKWRKNMPLKTASKATLNANHKFCTR